jgi:hypothetical protein
MPKTSLNEKQLAEITELLEVVRKLEQMIKEQREKDQLIDGELAIQTNPHYFVDFSSNSEF